MSQEDPWARFNPQGAPQQATPQPAQPANADPIVRRAPQPSQPSDFTVQTDTRDFNTDRGDEGFDRLTTYRNEFFDSPAVRDFQEVRIQAEQIQNLAQRNSGESSAMGDLGLVFSFMKTLDPGSTVREGEYATASNAAGIPERVRVAYNNLISGEGLSVEQRRDMAQTAQTLVQARARSYNDVVDRYSALIEAEGADPVLQGIERYGRPFGGVEVSRRPQQQRQNDIPVTMGGQQAPDAGPAPTMQDYYPQGAELGMDTWGRDNVFDRLAYLQSLGVEPEAETQLVGNLNALRGERATRESVLGVYNRLGINPPDDAGVNEIVEGLRAGKPAVGIDTRQAEEAYTRGLDEAIDQQDLNPEGRVETVAQGLGSGASLGFADEITGGINAIGAALSGEDPVSAYQVNRDIYRRTSERSREANPLTFGGSQVVGGLATGGVRAVPAALRASNPVRAAAQEGAVLGAIAGAGEGQGLGGTLGGAAVGAPLGAAVGSGLAALAPTVGRAAGNARNALLGPRAPKPNAADVQPVLAAGERRGVTVRRADVDPAVRNERGAALQGRRGGEIREAEAADLGELETALLRDLSGGNTSTRDEGGQAVQTGLRNAIDNTRKRAGNLYTAANAQVGGREFTPQRAFDVIDEQIADLTRLGEPPNSSRITYLRDLRNRLSRGGPQETGILDARGNMIQRPPPGLSIEGLRYQRTNLGTDLRNNNLYSTDFERRLNLVLDAAGKDIAEGLADNPQALSLYQQADRLWRQQARTQQRIGNALLGNDANPRSAADTANRVLSYAQGDPARLTRLMGTLDPAAQDEVRALVASQLGRSTNGNFTIDRLVTQLSDGSGGRLNARTARALFGDEGVAALQDLRVLANAKQAATVATNRSNTGGVVQRATAGMRRAILTGLGIADSGATGGAAMFVGNELASRLGEGRTIRLLLNPNFTGWLRSLPNTSNPAAINASFDRLRRTASRSSVFAADVNALEQALISAVNDNAVGAGRAVSEEEPQAN